MFSIKSCGNEAVNRGNSDGNIIQFRDRPCIILKMKFNTGTSQNTSLQEKIKTLENIRSRKIRISLGVCNTDVNKISHSFMLYYAGLIQVKNIKRKRKKLIRT